MITLKAWRAKTLILGRENVVGKTHLMSFRA